ncbi:MAG: hypothetical protein WBB25_08780 [Sulfitobacter sp.]
MIDARTFTKRSQSLQQMMQRKLGVKSRSLPQALRRAGRRLPRKLRREGAFLLEAQQLAGNPKLARQINPSRIDHAFDALTAYLDGVSAADLRKGWWLNLAGAIALNILIVLAGFLVWLWWRGYV